MFIMLISVLFIIIAVILTHEAGHAILTKMCGYEICHVALGAGKKILKINVFGIPFVIYSLPFGSKIVLKNDCHNHLKRILIAFGGILFNLATAFLAIFVVVNVLGEDVVSASDLTKKVGWVKRDSIFDQNNIAPGDTIVQVNGNNIGVSELMKEIYFSNKKRETYNVTIIPSQEYGKIFNTNLELSPENVSDILPSNFLIIDDNFVLDSVSGKKVYSNIVNAGFIDEHGKITSIDYTLSFEEDGIEIQKPYGAEYSDQGIWIDSMNTIENILKERGSIKINGFVASSFEEAARIFDKQELTVSFKKEGSQDERVVMLPLYNSFSMSKDQLVLNIAEELPLVFKTKKASFSSLEVFKFFLHLIYDVMYRIFIGSTKAIKMIKGLLGLMKETYAFHDFGIKNALVFFVILSIQGALFNLIPLYYCDCGSAIENIICLIFGKSADTVNYLYFLVSLTISMSFFLYQVFVIYI